MLYPASSNNMLTTRELLNDSESLNSTGTILYEIPSFLLDFRLVEILSCLFSLIALIVSMINSMQKKDANKRDEKVAKLYLNDLRSTSSRSELGEKPVSQIPRHVSLPNIKKVTLVEPTLDSPMPSPTSSINTPETGVFMP